MLDQHRRGETGRLSSFENGGGDVGSEVGEAENLTVVGSVEFFALGQIGELGSAPKQQLIVEPMALTIALIRLGSGFAGGANGSVWSITIRTSLPARRSCTG
jgi:hypothetical protein